MNIYIRKLAFGLLGVVILLLVICLHIPPATVATTQSLQPADSENIVKIVNEVAVNNLWGWQERLLAFGLLLQVAVVWAAIYFGKKNEKMHEAAELQISAMQKQNQTAQDQLDLLREQHMKDIAPKLVIKHVSLEGESELQDHEEAMSIKRKSRVIHLDNLSATNPAIDIFAAFFWGDYEYKSIDRGEYVTFSKTTEIATYLEPAKPTLHLIRSWYCSELADIVKQRVEAYRDDIYGVCVVISHDFENNTHLTVRILRITSHGQQEERCPQEQYSFAYSGEPIN